MMADSVRSFGGVAGESAVTEDLERGAQIINSAAELLADAGDELARAATYVETARMQGSEATRWAASTASGDLWSAQFAACGTNPVGREATDLADRLRRVADEFLDAERAAMAHVNAATRVRLAVGSMWGSGTWMVRHAWAAVLTVLPGPLSLTASGHGIVGAIRPDGLPPTTGLVNKDSVQWLTAGMDDAVVGFESQVYALAAVVATLEGLFGEGHASTVRRRPESHAPRASGKLADVMEGIQAQEDRMDGSVSIETVTHADGTRSHIVTIPGTEDWLANSDNPYDAHANLTAVVGDTSDAQTAVVDAMRAAGIRPGEEVMLAGHSQGGINAVALASRPEFLGEFNVTHVVTAGSPVGRIELSPSVSALHLEHSEDLVAGLDAAPNQGTATRTTVERDLMLSGDPYMETLGRDIGGAHHLNGYANTAALVDAGEAGTSATMWKASAAAFFTGDTSELTEYVPVVPPAKASATIDVIPPPAESPQPTTSVSRVRLPE